jgi:chromosome segregation ATPase
LEAAEEEIEAALRRTTDVHRTQLKHKEMELVEMRSNLEARDREVEGLRATLNAAKVSYDQRLAQLESNLMAREAEVGDSSAIIWHPCSTQHSNPQHNTAQQAQLYRLIASP